LLDIASPVVGYRFSGYGQTLIPQRQLLRVHTRLPEQSIALLVCSLVLAPKLSRGWNRVKDAPIKIAPAALRRSLEKSEAVAVDQHQGENIGQCRGSGCGCSIDPEMKSATCFT
jgi:hypothetical protein